MAEESKTLIGALLTPSLVTTLPMHWVHRL